MIPKKKLLGLKADPLFTTVASMNILYWLFLQICLTKYHY